MVRAIANRPIIAVTVSNGSVVSVSTNVRGLTGAQVVTVVDGESKRESLSIDEQLDALLDDAHRNELIVGVSMAAALAAERFLEISKTHYSAPEDALTDVKNIMSELSDILEKISRGQ